MEFGVGIGSLLNRGQHRLYCCGGGAACGARAHIALNPGNELFFVHLLVTGGYTCLKALTPHSVHCQVVPSSLVKMHTPPVATLMS